MSKIWVDGFLPKKHTKLTKLKVYKAFILSPGMMYCQVRSCVCMRGENTKTILKSVQKYCSLKTDII